MLNDDGCLQIRCDFFQPLDRSYRLGAIEIECRHSVRIVVLAEVYCIASDDDGAHLCQLDQQTRMARRVPWRAQHDHRTVTEYVLVDRLRFDLVLALDPAFERLEV